MSDDKIAKHPVQENNLSGESLEKGHYDLEYRVMHIRFLISLLSDCLFSLLEDIDCNERVEQLCSLSEVILEKYQNLEMTLGSL